MRHAIDLFKNHSEFCVFDLETTGFKPQNGAKTVQLAARRYRYDHDSRRATLLSEINELFDDPEITFIEPAVVAVHRIEVTDLRKRGRAPKGIWNSFEKMTQNAVLMGQNIISFDIPFANADAVRHNKNLRLDPERAIDTLAIAKAPGMWHLDNNGRNKPGYKLRSLADMLGVKTDPALDHDALGDIDTNWQVFLAMLPHIREYEAKFLKGTPNQYKREFGKIADLGLWGKDH